MQCSHTDADDIPEFLCRFCHPEMNRTPEQRDVLNAKDREALALRQASDNRAREIRRAQGEIASRTKHGELDPGSVAGKIITSLRAKVTRLQAEDLP